MRITPRQYLEKLEQEEREAQSKGLCYLNPERKCINPYECVKLSKRKIVSKIEELSASPEGNAFGSFTTLSSTVYSPVVCLEALPKNVKRALLKNK